MQDVTPGCFGLGTSNSTFSCGSCCWGGSGCLDFFLRRDSGYKSGLTPHVYDVIGTDLGSSFILCLNDAIPMNLQTFVSSYFSPYGGGPDGGSSGFLISDDETHLDTFRPQGGGLRLDNLGDEEVLDTSADNSFVTPRPTSAWDAANEVLFTDYPFFSPQVGNSFGNSLVHVVPPRPTRVWNDEDYSYVHVVPPRPTRVWNARYGIDDFDDNFTIKEDTEAVSSATFCDISSDDFSSSLSLIHIS